MSTARALAGWRVRDAMTPDPITVGAGDTLEGMVDHAVTPQRFTTYPVVDDLGRPVGLLPFRSVAGGPPLAVGRDVGG